MQWLLLLDDYTDLRNNSAHRFKTETSQAINTQNFQFLGWHKKFNLPVYIERSKLPSNIQFDGRGNNLARVEFESKLAYMIISSEKSFFFDALRKVSKGVLLFIDLVESLTNGTKFIKNFSDYVFRHKQHFGRLQENEQEGLSEEQQLQKIKQTLNDAESIENIMYIHLASILLFQKCFNNKMLNESDRATRFYSKYCPKLFENTMLQNRKRVFVPGLRKSSNSVGIINGDLQLEFTVQEHTRAVDYVFRDFSLQDDFSRLSYEWDIPYVSGPSTHTIYLLLAAIVFGNYEQSRLQKQELSYYALACAGFLVAAGAHSFDEVMIVAHKVGLPYSHAHYLESIPNEFTQSEGFKQLQKEYSAFFVSNRGGKRKSASEGSDSSKKTKTENANKGDDNEPILR